MNVAEITVKINAIVGDDKEAPAWYSKLHSGLKKVEDASSPSPDAEALDLLTKAKAATKTASVREGIADVLDGIAAAEKARKGKGKPLYAAAFANDGDSKSAFDAGGGDKGTYFLYAAAVDRKNLGASAVVAYPGNPVAATRRKVDAAPLEAWARAAAGPASSSVADFRAAYEGASDLPAFPKPKSVLAAEDRAAKRKARDASVAAVGSKADLDRYCYALSGTKTCVVGVGAEDADLAPLAAKYAREGFAFCAVAADAPVAAALLGSDAPPDEPALVVVKTGKRPRATRAFGVDAFAPALDNVLGGGASFAKFADGLPAWPEAEAAPADDEPAAADDADADADADGDEYDL